MNSVVSRLRAAVLAALLGGGGLTASAAPRDGFPEGIQLPERARGDAAVQALGARLPEVAAFYRKTPAEFRALLARDKSLWVDGGGRLFHVCEWGQPAAEGVTGTSVGTTAPAPFPPEQAFRLHSRPGSGKVIYLDFDGHDASATSWGADAIGRPFDTDGQPQTFSASERTLIIGVWQRVAEDFAMYDVDVTTEDPGTAALINSGGGDTNYGIRVPIAGSSSDWYGSAGGVAYIGSFNWSSDTPCWVFPKSLGPDNEKSIAEAVSHEVGHTLGLSHDGLSVGVDAITQKPDYYSGQGNWAPIMGVGYYKPIAQWSKGEYANANQTQDDLAVMPGYGVAYRADDHGNSLATATPLTGVAFATNGVITTRTDLDFFTFTTGAGRVTLNVSRAPRDSNLRIEIKLYDALGTLLQTTNVADTTAGTQPVTLTAVLPAGTYAFSVDGIGADDPLTTGYSDYASLGQYLITGTLPNDTAWLPTAGGNYLWLATANWASNTVPNGVGATVRISNNPGGDQLIELAGPLTLGRLLLGDSDASHIFTLGDGGGGSLTFASLTNTASVSKTTGAADVIALPVTLQSTVRVTNTTASPLTFSGNMGGPGALVKAGAGTVILSGAANPGGGTLIETGTLALTGAASLGGAVDVRSLGTLDLFGLGGGLVLAPNQILRGDGVVQGDVTAGTNALVQPGAAGAAGVLTLAGRFAAQDGARLQFDLATTNTVGGGVNDLLFVGGDLDLSGTVRVGFNFLNQLPASPATYTLIQYAGTLTGSAANLVADAQTNRFSFAFDDSTPGEIRVTVAGAPLPLVWTGDGSNNVWNAAAATNWLAAGLPEVFQPLDSILFDETGATSAVVTLNGALAPLSVAVSNTAAYTLGGPGKLTGGTGLTKSGSGTLVLGTANDFTGAVAVNEGTLRLANAAALGAATGTTVASGAALDLNGNAVGLEPLTIAGTGPTGAGALVNNGGAQSNAVRFLALSGPATLGGTGRWDVRAQPTATFTGNNFSLTKTGANEIRLADLGNTGLGDITVAQGTLTIQDTTTLGAANSNLTVQAGAVLSFVNTDSNALNKRLVLNGGTVRSDAGNNLFIGPVTLNTNSTVFVNAAQEFQGVMAGTAGLTKTGTGTLSLRAANTFTGAVTVSTGTLRAGNNAAFGVTNGGVIIASDARLDLGGFNLGAEPVTAIGDGLGNAGAIVNSGGTQTNALRFVTLSGATTFGGISRWDIRANPAGALTGAGFALTKRGPNEIRLANLGNTGLGAITVAEGTLSIEGATGLGALGSTLTVNSGTALALYNTGTNAAKTLSFSSGRLQNAAGTNVFAGNVGLSGGPNLLEVAASTSLELSGVLSGTGSLIKTNAGVLILSSNNTRTGFTVIAGGTLQLGNGGGAGSPGSGVITNDGVLIYNRTNDLTLSAVIAGGGSLTKLGSGVLTLSGANTFTGAVTVNALNAGILRLRNNTALGTGVKTVNLKSGGSPNSAGSFGVEVENNLTLDTNLTWNISNDGALNAPFLPALRSRSGNNTVLGNILIQSGGGGARIASDAGSTLNLNGRITTDVSAGRDLILDGAGTGVVNGVITNGAASGFALAVQKDGAGTWTLAGNNPYTGPTLVKAGTLLVTGATGTNFLTVSNGATLRGTGTVRGATTINGTLAPGSAAAPGALTVSHALTLNGDAQFRLTKSPAPGGDRVQGITALTCGGTLTATLTGGPLTLGDTFQLFSAGSFAGDFSAVVLPPTPPTLVWSNRLALDGTLVVALMPPPVISGVTFDGVSLALQFASENGVNYLLEAATNLEPPVVWSPVSTNAGNGGVLTVNAPFVAEQERQFFRLNAY